ncbi:MAG: SDR family oxidoreductase [Tannerella sp.]|jgi:short-subunit dehydrogenase|nr:SDR family oxidoreductase [Tannerella sp.]
MNVKNKTIVVTGGGNGMGRELVLQLLAKGANVAAVDINEAALSTTESLSGDKKSHLSVNVVDITDREAVENLSKQVVAQFGAIDGVINNAGIIQPFVRFNDLDFATIDKVISVDFFGMLNMTKLFLPCLLKRPEAHIVNISSMGGLFPVPGGASYGAAKAAVKQFTDILNAELRNTHVRMTVVCPGGVQTDIKFNSGAAEARFDENELKKAFIKPVKPAKAAEIIIDAIEKNRYKVLIGKDIKAINFIHKLFPNMAQKIINKKMKLHIPD